MKAWLALAAYEGFRCKEIAGLRREDVQDTRSPPVIRVQQGKGGHQAVLPLNPFTASVLRSYGLPRRGYVFLSKEGRPFQARTVSMYGNAYLRDLGIDGTMHQLRHWFGTAVWSQTKDMRVTQELLRHANPATTAGYAVTTTKNPDILTALVLLFLCLIPGIVYLVVARKTITAPFAVQVTPDGEGSTLTWTGQGVGFLAAQQAVNGLPA